MAALYHSYILPWTAIPEEDARLKRNLQIALVLAIVFGLVVPFLPVKEVDKTKVEELPPRLAQLVVEKKKPKPPPPPPKVEKKKEKKKEKPKKKKEEKKKEKPKPKPKPKPKEKSQAELIAEARKKAKSTGLLALSDELSDLRDTTPKLNKSKKLSKGAAQAKTVKRSILTSNVASSGSGGIDTSALSTGVGRSSLEGRQTTQVDSPVEQVAQNARVEADKRSNKPSRTYEEVSLVFDKNKGAIYSIYNRALRKDPTLEGKIVIEITIDPTGAVTNVKIVSSELNSPSLEKKLIARIKLFNFGPKEVETLIVTYPIDFLPP